MLRPTRQYLLALLTLTACGGTPKPEAPVPVTDATPSSTPVRPASTDDSRTKAMREEAARVAAMLAEPIFFGYDEAALSPAARATLDAKAALLRATPGMRLVINGHADERGSDEYNLALGMRRATAAQRYIARAGVPSARVEVVSYGEERPAVQGHDERAFAANRRDEFVVTGGQLSQE